MLSHCTDCSCCHHFWFKHLWVWSNSNMGNIHDLHWFRREDLGK